MKQGSIKKLKYSATNVDSGQSLFTKECKFLTGCVSLKQMPSSDVSEIAFAGRSNVGKSSLINALTNNKSLARTSNKPGRTREINFFNLGKCLTIVDLPGYGYAKAPRSLIKNWNILVNDYLIERKQLKRIFVLIDARHGLKKNDLEFLSLMDDAAQSYQLILTKCDKIKSTMINIQAKAQQNALEQHPASISKICCTSSKTGDGLPELRSIIATLV